MAKGDGLELSLKFDPAQARKARNAFKPYLRVPQVLLGGELLQNLILERTQQRFDPVNTSNTAQKTPRNKKWRPLAKATIRSGGTQSRKLYREGTLKDSIAVIKDNLKSALYTNTGAGFRVGVRADSEAAEYARIQNQGGWAGKNNLVWIPARRFLGIGQADKIAINKLIKSVADKEGI